ncbi:hypothetical protein SPB21_18225 [Leptothoe sp. ISB3NOV94-8A]
MWLKIPIDLENEAANVHLLQELDRWIELGLLSEAQVISLGRKLCSPLPIAHKAPTAVQQKSVEVNTEVRRSETAPPETLTEVPTATGQPFFSRFKSHLVQSFLAEVSVLWLLFLGVFLVVVSSGVLVASQWQSFSIVGQYSILLVYTLAFGGASHWAAGQAKLKTTAQMLKATTLLLIPLNMWMIDTSGLINTTAGLAIVASIGLSILTLVLAPQRMIGLTVLGLSWLHWGWGFATWPLIATYVGTLSSAISLVRDMPKITAEETGEDREAESQPQGILVAIALLILLVRSVWIAQIPIAQLGLAMGLCGWVLRRLYQRYPLWPQLGAGLMLLGWLVSVIPYPLQALGISGLAIWLLLEQLGQHTQERDQLRTLSRLWLVGLQACGLVWLTLPGPLRQTILLAVGSLSQDPVSTIEFSGLWLYGYVGLMVVGAKRFRQKEHTAWAQLTENLAMGLSPLLVLLIVPQAQSFLLMMSLLGQTLTLGAITRLRRPATNWLIYCTHISALATVISGLYVISGWFGYWNRWQGALVFLSLMTVEWIASVASHRYPQWRQSSWYLGIGLSIIAYSLLLDNWGSWINLSWLVVPGLLTWLAYRRQLVAQPQLVTTALTVLALGSQILLISSWPMATVALFTGAGLLYLHSQRWPTQTFLPVITIGFALGGGHAAAIWLWLMPKVWPENVASLFLVIALFSGGLSILARQLKHQAQPLLRAYGNASYGWSRALAVALSFDLTLIMVLSYSLNYPFAEAQAISPDVATLLQYGAAAMALILARFFTERRLSNLDYWEVSHGVGLLVAMGLTLWHQEMKPQMLATAMVALGLGTQMLGSIYVAKHQRNYPSSWHYIPLAYGALGLVLSHLNFTAITGVYSFVVGIVVLAIGRRQTDLRPLGYGGLGLLSLGTYELVVYQMLQASGGEPGDGLTLLALVGSAIAPLYLLGDRWIQRYSKLTTSEIATGSLLHWLLSVMLAALAMISGHSQLGVWLWLSTSCFLTLYALLRGNSRWFPAYATNAKSGHIVQLNGNHHSYRQWTWSGLVIATIAVSYGVDHLLSHLTLLRGWGALFACLFSLIAHRLPWQRWGWPMRPWQRIAIVWPVLATLLSITTITTQSLLLIGAFYAAMAKQLRAVRLSYLSLGLLNWALLRYLFDQAWLTPLWLGTMIGISVLYILEVDPRWQLVSAREERHRLRSLATLLIGLTAIFQAETTSALFISLSLLISFGFIGLGLFTRVRAYLYVGTLTFSLQILRAIALFISTDGRMLWAIGILLGIALIWVAATFEARRAQISELLNKWAYMLQTWE